MQDIPQLLYLGPACVLAPQFEVRELPWRWTGFFPFPFADGYWMHGSQLSKLDLSES
jgi:hypothetical protein